MPLLLRKIRKHRWYGKEEVWLPDGKAQADALSDLATTDNKLSVWHIEDDKSNLNQVVAAVSCTRDHAANFDYALFDQTLLAQIPASIENTTGHTFHEEAGDCWHRHIVELSAEKTAQLANTIMQCGTKARVSEARVIELIKQAVASGAIDAHKLKDGLKNEII